MNIMDNHMSKIRTNNKTHFFQPLLQNFKYNFSIPKAFVKNFGENLKAKNEEKRAELRDKTGRSWYVKLVFTSGENRPHFENGWESFCNDHNLQMGDFLVFKHQGDFVFDVLIFAPTACERELPIFDSRSEMKSSTPNVNKPSIAKKKLKGEDTRMDKTIFKSSSRPWCRTIVKPYCLKWHAMPLPREFAEKNGLSKRWCDIVIIDEEGRSWKMHLRYKRHVKNGAPYIGKWNAFHEANGLNVGDHVIFQLINHGENPLMKFYRD